MKKLIIILIVFSIITSCNDSHDYFLQAKKSFKAKEYEKALMKINKAIKLSPDSTKYYFLRAVIYEDTKNYELAIKDYSFLIQLSDTSKTNKYSYYLHRGFDEAEIGLYSKAIADIDTFLNNTKISKTKNFFNTLALAYLTKGTALNEMGKQKLAKECYELAIHQDSLSPFIKSDILLGFSNIEVDNKHFSKGLNLINQAIQIDSLNSKALGARGKIFADLGETRNALKDYSRAIKLDPNNSSLYFNLAMIQVNDSKEYKLSIDNFKQAIRLSPSSPENFLAYYNMSYANMITGNQKDALDNIIQADKIQPNNPEILDHYARILSSQGRNLEALEKVSKSIQLEPSVEDHLILKGGILIDLQKYAEAEILFKQILKNNKSSGESYFNLGFIYGKLDDPKKSIIYYSKAIILKCSLEGALVNRAHEYIKTEQYRLASNDLKGAIKLGRTDVIPLLNKCESNQ